MQSVKINPRRASDIEHNEAIKLVGKEITLHFQNLSKVVTLQEKKNKCTCWRNRKKVGYLEEKKQILTNANGCLLPGEIMAIMGPSGSGKTTLLNILACRSMVGVTGSVYINSEKMKRSFKRKIGYVLQEDIFFTNLTIREQLVFTALLKLPGKKSSKLSRVNELIHEFNLEKCADTKILLISGGEKKNG